MSREASDPKQLIDAIWFGSDVDADRRFLFAEADIEPPSESRECLHSPSNLSDNLLLSNGENKRSDVLSLPMTSECAVSSWKGMQNQCRDNVHQMFDFELRAGFTNAERRKNEIESLGFCIH